MSDWPPKPENEIQNTNSQSISPLATNGNCLEKAVLASVEEQRRARRWGIFFKFLTFAYLLVVFWLLKAKAVVLQSLRMHGTAAGSHIAVVDIVGTIAADKQSVNSSRYHQIIEKSL